MKFDGKRIGFTHDRTWASMPMALTGKFDAGAVLRQLGTAHPRVARSISALCSLGVARPLETFRFKDHPNAGIKEVENLCYGPEVTILAKATCWYNYRQTTIIPLLQPRNTDFSMHKLGIYAALGRKAFCKGDWSSAHVEIVDLSQSDEDKTVHARVFTEEDVPLVSDDELTDFLDTYLAGYELAATLRKERKSKEEKKKPSASPLFPDHDDDSPT